VIEFAIIEFVPGAVGAWYETHGTTVDWITGATNVGDGTLTEVLPIPIIPSTAPAGSVPASSKILAMANAIKSFTLITIPSLVIQYLVHQNKKLISGKGIFLRYKPLI
jgi:hypothetical protein